MEPAIIFNYFKQSSLTPLQIRQFAQLELLYREWNQKINLVSRKDIDNLYLHHVLHSLSIARFVQFKEGSKILDLGTGGGFPGIPLAIFFPQAHFTLIDGTGKKIKAVKAICEATGIENVTPVHIRAEELKAQFDFVVSRAVASLDKLLLWSRHLLKKREQNAIPNGLIALKGGNVSEEIKTLPRGEYVEKIPITNYFDLPYFSDKYIIYIQR